MEILKFNMQHHLLFFRITSDLIPFASHPVCTFPWQKAFKKEFREIRNFIKKHRMRVSMHPDQFTLINSIDRDIFRRSSAELRYHAEVLDLLNTDLTAKIQIHIGGAYGDKQKSMDRFVKRYIRLPQKIRQRLTIENDERTYSIKDCISVHRDTGVPVVFDTLHNNCNPGNLGFMKAFTLSHATWKRKDGPLIVDYSSQNRRKRKGSHAGSIDLRDFRKFLSKTKDYDFDIMCEIKDKEKSALKAAGVLRKKYSLPVLL
jgi:UV DNA damage endonuclease